MDADVPNNDASDDDFENLLNASSLKIISYSSVRVNEVWIYIKFEEFESHGRIHKDTSISQFWEDNAL
ncbi:unnamed protein product, partial [Acanthocheilonema viteae]